ncbi:hypothetical protein [Streptomyces platensis]|uniref:hypothetical protein n=1 Tax=Streptomyces platensis TaxID=58346 RepID=UPI00369E43A8
MTETSMRQGTCTSCGSQEIYLLERITRQFMVKLGFTGVENILAKVMVCLECGRCEQYLQLKEKQKQKIRNEAPRVQG